MWEKSNTIPSIINLHNDSHYKVAKFHTLWDLLKHVQYS